MYTGIISEQHERNKYFSRCSQPSKYSHTSASASLRLLQRVTGGWPEIWNGSLRTRPYANHSSVSVLCSIHPWLFQTIYTVILTCMPLSYIHECQKGGGCFFRNTHSRAPGWRGWEMAKQRTGFSVHTGGFSNSTSRVSNITYAQLFQFFPYRNLEVFYMLVCSQTVCLGWLWTAGTVLWTFTALHLTFFVCLTW